MTVNNTLSSRIIRGVGMMAILVGGLLAPSLAHAFDEFDYDLRLARALADIGMTDYAFLQVDRLLKLYPEKQDLAYITKAQIHYQLNQRSQGNEALDRIRPNSPYYSQAQMLVAKRAMERGDYDTAEKAYKAYFAVNKTPSGKDPASIKIFIESVQMYAQVSVQRGEPEAAQNVVDLLKGIEGDDALNDAQIAFLKGQLALAAEENRIDAGGEVNEVLVADVVKTLENVQWSAGLNYAIMVGALIEAAHGRVMLGKNKEAIQTLESISEQLLMLDRSMPKSESPVAAAFYYYGKALKGLGFQAFKTGEKERAGKFLQAGARRFRKVNEDYAQSGYSTRALVEFGKCRELLLTQFDPPIVIEGPEADVGSLIMKQEQAEKYFAAKDYEMAAPLYLESARLGRTSSRFPVIANRLIYSYGQLGRFLEAQSLASYLAEAHSSAEETGASLLQLGAILLNQANATADGPVKEALTEAAMGTWNTLAEVAPDYPNAAEVAFAVAENAYGKAAARVEAADRATEKAEKEQLKSEARELFRAAIPLYERMVDVFGSSPKGVRAHYKLGWIYYSIDEPRTAADEFIKYSVLEKDPKYQDDRIEAKFRAADQLMFSDTPAESIPHFKEVIVWLQVDNPFGFDVDTDTAVRIREDATSYLAWSHDLAAEVFRPQIRTIDETIKQLTTEISEYQAGAVAAAARAAAAAALVEQASTVFAGQVKVLEAGLPAPEAKALAERMPDDAKLAGLSEQDRQFTIERAKAEAAELAAKYRTQFNQQYDAEKAEVTEHQTEVFERRKELLAEGEALAERITDIGDALAAADDELVEVRADLARRTGELGTAEQAVTAVRGEIEKWRAELVRARELFESGSAEERTEARAIRDEAMQSLRSLGPDLKEAQARLDDVQTPTNQAEIASLERQVSVLERRLLSLKTQQVINERDKAIQEKDLAYTEALLKTLGKQLEWNGLVVDLLKLPEAERNSEANTDTWQQARAAVLASLQELKQRETEKAMLLQTIAQEEEAGARKAETEATGKIASLQATREPLAKQFNELKRQAQKYFEAFVEAYPQSEDVAENMARIGSIYLEFEDYAKASEWLNRLNAEFKGSKAAEQALFSLGKAQYETGKAEAAAASFAKVLDNMSEQSAGNLNYIARRMTETGQPEVGMKVIRELLARSADVQSEDYELLSGKARENLLFRAAEASFAAGDYKNTISYANELIQENKRTAHFYRIKLISAQAKRLSTPPDLIGGRRDLLEIRRFAQDSVVTNEALVELARNFLAQDDAEGTRKALAQLGQIVPVSEGDVAVLADMTQPGNKPLVGEALYLAAKCYALMGMDDRREMMVKAYLRDYPGGPSTDKIKALPAARFSNAFSLDQTNPGSGT